MKALTDFRKCLLVCSLIVVLQPLHRTRLQETATQRDGQHDFDFEIGSWKTHLSRLQHPLSGSHTWVEYEGASVGAQNLGWPRQSRGTRGGRSYRPRRRAQPASLQSSITSVEPKFRQC